MSSFSYSKAKNQALNNSSALWLGVIFSFVFTGLIWLSAPYLPKIDFLPDQGASWYYWQLPEPTFWSRATAWGFYTLHQLAMWWLIYQGQKNKLKYTNGIHRLNILALGVNAFFSVLHVIQTHVWFDGLAQDVSIWSSQWSVILMLVLILLMENQRRGLFFGKKVKGTWIKEAAQFTRKYHGYLFAWGIIYTFWYHPTVSTPGHLLGFLYTSLLMVQGSLMFTRAHLNKWWTVALELSVLVHGVIVAVSQVEYDIWPMFLFGFLAMFVITQMHGLGLKSWLKWGMGGMFVIFAGVVYSSRGWIRLEEIIRIPLIEYLTVFVLAFLIWSGIRSVNWLRSLWRDKAPAQKPESLSVGG